VPAAALVGQQPGGDSQCVENSDGRPGNGDSLEVKILEKPVIKRQTADKQNGVGRL
jgi:hypothetical protein